ncbi:unnamed protein product [Linum tenue]|uniref:Uncharacterized protein n=1 Tax=Linum tenue TaxID=586396 RepID=A0AAV0IYA1_9ROSI|nr:unnamed protein product [Linum tenue]
MQRKPRSSAFSSVDNQAQGGDATEYCMWSIWSRSGNARQSRTQRAVAVTRTRTLTATAAVRVLVHATVTPELTVKESLYERSLKLVVLLG